MIASCQNGSISFITTAVSISIVSTASTWLTIFKVAGTHLRYLSLSLSLCFLNILYLRNYLISFKYLSVSIHLYVLGFFPLNIILCIFQGQSGKLLGRLPCIIPGSEILTWFKEVNICEEPGSVVTSQSFRRCLTYPHNMNRIFKTKKENI